MNGFKGPDSLFGLRAPMPALETEEMLCKMNASVLGSGDRVRVAGLRER